MHTVHFLPIAALLCMDAFAGLQQLAEQSLWLGLLAFDLADHSAQMGPEFAGASTRPFHLAGMGLAALTHE
jgi:hypothetical protein